MVSLGDAPAVGSTGLGQSSPNPFPPFSARVTRMNFPGSCKEVVARPADLREAERPFPGPDQTAPALPSYTAAPAGHGGSRASKMGKDPFFFGRETCGILAP